MQCSPLARSGSASSDSREPGSFPTADRCHLSWKSFSMPRTAALLRLGSIRARRRHHQSDDRIARRARAAADRVERGGRTRSYRQRHECLSIGEVTISSDSPRVAAVVPTGAVATTAAAMAGAPQVVIPQMFDQFYWAETCGAFGSAVPTRGAPTTRIRGDPGAPARLARGRRRQVGSRCTTADLRDGPVAARCLLN